MAWHHIDVPKKRSLDWIEKKVHDYLWGGLTPEQVALKCRKPLKKGWSLTGDAPDSIYDIMSRIREKGHELPVIINKEDESMQKYTDKQKNKALSLFDDGMKPSEIATKLKINYKTVSKWTCDYKKQKAEFEALIEEGSKAEFADDFDPCEFMSAETPPIVVNADTDIETLQKAWAEYEATKEEPASAATDTDSMVESFGKESTDIIPENIEPVKSRYFSDDACEAIVERLNLLYGELDEISMQMIKKIEAIEKINASIDELDSVACGIQFRIQELEADLVVIAGGVVGE